MKMLILSYTQYNMSYQIFLPNVKILGAEVSENLCRKKSLHTHTHTHTHTSIITEKTKTIYEGESISNQPYLFPVEIHLFFFDVIAL